MANARIKMWGEQVVNRNGTLNTAFIELRDIRISIGISNGNNRWLHPQCSHGKGRKGD